MSPARGRDPELSAALRPVERRLRRVEALARLSRWAWVGPAAAGLVTLASWLWPLAGRGAWALGLALGLPAALALLPLLRREPLENRALRADRALRLRDRILTACYLGPAIDALSPIGDAAVAPAREEPAAAVEMARRQRADALTRLAAFEPAADLPWRFSRRGLSAAGLLAAMVLVLQLLPNPQQERLDRRAALRQAAASASLRISTLRAEVEALAAGADASAESPEPSLDRLAAELRRLETELAGSRGRAEEDLSALARAETNLSGLRDPAALDRALRAEDLRVELSGLAGSDTPAASTDVAAAELATRLARSLATASAAERQALADRLETLADRLAPDLATAAEDLRAAARAAREARDEVAAEAVSAAAERAAQARAEAEPARQVERALDEIDAGRRRVAAAQAGEERAASATGAAAPEVAGDGGGSSPAGAGDGGGSGSGAGEGSVSSGAGASDAGEEGASGGAPDGSGVGDPQLGAAEPDDSEEVAGASGSAPSEPAGLAGEPLLPAAGGDRLHAPGPRPQVTTVPRFLPAGSETSAEAPSTGRRPVAPGTASESDLTRPLAEALPSYREAAGAALAREALPVDRRDYVRAYFEALAR